MVISLKRTLIYKRVYKRRKKNSEKDEDLQRSGHSPEGHSWLERSIATGSKKRKRVRSFAKKPTSRLIQLDLDQELLSASTAFLRATLTPGWL